VPAEVAQPKSDRRTNRSKHSLIDTSCISTTGALISKLEVPIAGVFALDDVRDAYREVELRHTRGKLVLRP
jgi:hypothetical protein